jgi:catechol 2,3-dioxygenase-like lactoylglutathione lyase family enzyme
LVGIRDIISNMLRYETGPASTNATRIVQVALSAVDAVRSARWYEHGLGYLPAGDRHPTAPLSAVQGLPDAEVEIVVWLVDRQGFFQLEIFQYNSPPPRLQAADRSAADIGWSSFGVWVADFDATLDRLRALGAGPVAAPVGPPGQRRSSAVDPDGIVVEIFEGDPAPPWHTPPVNPRCQVVTRSVTASVSDLERSLAYFSAAIGLTVVTTGPTHDDLHADPEAGEVRRTVLDGGDIWLELVEHVSPSGRPRAAGYRLNDQGLLNIAVGKRTLGEYVELRDRVAAAGYRMHEEIARDRLRIHYAEDADGFSVELGFYAPELDAPQGFLPLPSTPRPGDAA